VRKKMPFDDLDLEFVDDEEEARRKKKDAVEVDVDLEFQAPEGMSRPLPQSLRPASAGTNSNIQRPQLQKPAEIRNITEARAPQAPSRPAPPTQTSASQQIRTAGSSALQAEGIYDVDSQQIVELREQIRKVELEAQVKVAVAEFKTEFLTEMLSDMKLASHQVEQLLVRINAKHPDLKNEVLMIKKILTDFIAKKRK
jgi:hypothetical protein